MLRAGHVHIAVSAQKAGVDGEAGGGIGGFGSPLAASDPERYGDLAHPGDPYSYDIFRQVGRTGATWPRSPAPTRWTGSHARTSSPPVSPSRRSGSRPTSTDPTARHGVRRIPGAFARWGAAPLDDTDGLTSGIAGAIQIRDDLEQPTMIFTTETDLTVLGYAAARQPDTDTVVNWEVAGTAHADAFLIGGDPQVRGRRPRMPTAGQRRTTGHRPQGIAPGLVDWVVDGAAPPTGDGSRSTTTGRSCGTTTAALGGIRLPAVDVPFAACPAIPPRTPASSVRSSARPSRSERTRWPPATARPRTTSPPWTRLRRGRGGRLRARCRPPDGRRRARSCRSPDRSARGARPSRRTGCRRRLG